MAAFRLLELLSSSCLRCLIDRTRWHMVAMVRAIIITIMATVAITVIAAIDLPPATEFTYGGSLKIVSDAMAMPVNLNDGEWHKGNKWITSSILSFDVKNQLATCFKQFNSIVRHTNIFLFMLELVLLGCIIACVGWLDCNANSTRKW